jgi:transposase
MSPRHDGCVRAPRTTKKSVEIPREKEKKGKVVAAKTGAKRKQDEASVPSAAKDCQPQPLKKAAGKAGTSRGLQSEDCRAAKTRRKPEVSMKNQTLPTAAKPLLFIGLDVHKDSIAIAIAEEGRNGEVRSFGSVSGDLLALERVLARICKAHEMEKSQLRGVYEAGPCGFVIARRLEQLGIACIVIAPSMIPEKSGDRVKTDKRDAIKLARLHRAGELQAINIPDAADEAIRDLCRARTDAVNDQRSLRSQFKGFLLRHGYKYSGKTSWNDAHLRYLRELRLPNLAHRALLEESLLAVNQANERVVRLTELIEAHYLKWERRGWCDALMAFKGMQMLTAVTLVAEIGDITRFSHPRQLMAYLGLTPSQYSSGEKVRMGGITKCGNHHARWFLIECAQHYALNPKVSKELTSRQEGLSARIKEISWNAQTRLNQRYRALLAHGKCRQKAITAVARELLGFVWALLREYREPGAVLPREARRPVRAYTMKPRVAAAAA